MANEVTYSVDLDELEKQLEEQRKEDDFSDNDDFSVRTSIFTLGKDPRVQQDHLSAPDLRLIEVLKDGLQNPYLELNWRIAREDMDSGKVTGFEVYRRKLRPEESTSYFTVTKYDKDAFDKLSRKNKKVGKFSEEKKAMNNIRKGMIDLSNLNHNLSLYKSQQENSMYKTSTESGYKEPFDFGLNDYSFSKIATVSYTKFLAQEKQKFLFVQDRNFVDMTYRDKAVGYGETFEYYVQTITKEYGKNNKSNSVAITLEDLTPVSPVNDLVLKQVKEDEIQITVLINMNDMPSKLFMYRKSEEQINFEFLGELPIIKDSILITDSGIRYGKQYTYRAFIQNIHGLLSPPKEVSIYSSVQKITPETRSNNLKQPVFSVVQDQNSDFIKINMFPNDPLIYYYELDRRDLTIKEKKFVTPSKSTNGYGGDGWVTNKFVVKKTREEIQNNDTNFISKMTFDQIEFIDDTIQFGHIYQYRVRGYDLFGNPTSYAFGLVKAQNKKNLRTPINLRAEIIRGYPFRVKILWDDDNLANTLNSQDVATESQQIKTLYKVQRRKIDETVYETFPITPGNFIIDEVPTNDAVNFDGQVFGKSDNFKQIDNLDVNDDQLNLALKQRRAFSLPNFLADNATYFYRVFAVDASKEQESNATQEYKLITIADISEPLEFGAEIINTKVKPMVARLSWKNDSTKALPDCWTIERKVDTENEGFLTIGKTYLESQFLDYNITPGYTYIYRIRSNDTLGRVSNYAEARLTV